MEFTKELVEKNYLLLSSSQSKDERSNANKYLLEFQKSPNAFHISFELLDNMNQNIQFIGAQMIYQKIKENLTELSKSKEEFQNYRDLIFNRLYEKLKVLPTKVIDRLCLTMSLFTIIGIVGNWENCVEDLITFAKNSIDTCLLVLIIFENIPKELEELKFNEQDFFKIKDNFQMKIKIIDEFVQSVFSLNLDSEAILPFKKVLIEKLFCLISALNYFGMNVLNHPNLCNQILSYFNENYIDLISKIFSESFCKSSLSKIYTNEIYSIEEIKAKSDPISLISVQSIVKLISENTFKYIPLYNNETNELTKIEYLKIINSLSSILEEILENFCFILFFKDEVSKIAFDLLKFFTIFQNKKISRRMFETFSEMREFVNMGYLLENFNDQERKEFSDYLISIIEGVMANSKLSSLDFSDNNNLNLDFDVDENLYVNEHEITVQDYRKNAEDIFYNIFLILSHNFTNGGSIYFSKFYSILEQLNCDKIEILSNLDHLLIVEVIIFTIKSIADAVQALSYDNLVVDFVNIIHNSVLLQNDRILHSFLILLDSTCTFVAKENNCVDKTVNLLTQLVKNRKMENIASEVLLSISESMTQTNISYFINLFEIFKQNFMNLTRDSSKHLTESLCNFIGYKDKNKKVAGITFDELIDYYTQILNFALEKINYFFSFILQQNNKENNKLEIIKCFTVVNVALKNSCLLNKQMFSKISYVYLNNSLKLTKEIFVVFCNDYTFINQLSTIYMKIISNLEEKSLEFFDDFNEIMLKCFSNNNENYELLNVLSVIYRLAGDFKSNKVEYIVNNFHLISDLISKAILTNTSKKIEIIEAFANLYTKVLDHIKTVNLTKEQIYRDVNLFCDAISNIAEPQMNGSIIKLFKSLIIGRSGLGNIEFNEILKNLVFIVIKCCSHFEIGISLEISRFLILAIQSDLESTVNSIRQGLINEYSFRKISTEDVEVILKFIVYFSSSEKEVKTIICDLINYSKFTTNYDFSIYRVRVEAKEKLFELQKKQVINLEAA